MEVNEAEIGKYIPGVRKKLEWLSEEDLLKRVLSLEFNRLLKYYQNTPDIDLNEGEKRSRKEKGEKRERGERRDKDRRDAEPGYERLMVNVGKGEGFFPGNLMDIINRNVVGPKPEIGRIDLLPDYTLFDVRKEDAHKVIDALRNVDFFGNRLRAEIAGDGDYSGKGRKRKKGSSKDSDKGYGKDKGASGRSKSAKREKPSKEKRSKDAEIGGKSGRKSKKEKASRPDYHGNYDMFIKKKK